MKIEGYLLVSNEETYLKNIWKALGNKHIQDAVMMGKANKGQKGKLHKGLRQLKYRTNIMHKPSWLFQQIYLSVM